jgi:hypothetical protein
MKKTKIKIISLGLLSLAASAALANGEGGKGYDAKGNDAKGDDHQRCRSDDRKCWSAPEIDPAQALGGLVLLSGAVAIVRGRRRRK